MLLKEASPPLMAGPVPSGLMCTAVLQMVLQIHHLLACLTSPPPSLDNPFGVDEIHLKATWKDGSGWPKTHPVLVTNRVHVSCRTTSSVRHRSAALDCVLQTLDTSNLDFTASVLGVCSEQKNTKTKPRSLRSWYSISSSI